VSARDFHAGEAVQLSDVDVADKPVWIQIAKTGTFAGHHSGPFTLNEKVFGEVIANFKATENRSIIVDFEHASEADETSGSIPTSGAPAQGWVTDIRSSGGNLFGLVDWLEPARTYIREGKYKWISPGIRFACKDQVTGRQIGARLTSVALVGRPFLDGMRPVTAKDTAPATAPAKTFTGRTRELMANGMSYADAQIKASEELRAVEAPPVTDAPTPPPAPRIFAPEPTGYPRLDAFIDEKMGVYRGPPTDIGRSRQEAQEDAERRRNAELERRRLLSIQSYRVTCTVLDAPTTRTGDLGIANAGGTVFLDDETAARWRALGLLASSDGAQYVARKRLARSGPFGLQAVEVGHVVEGLSDVELAELVAVGAVEPVDAETTAKRSRRSGR
jgi:hypothetical protein